MKLSLEVLTEGRQKGKLLPITLSQFLIGRDPQCHLRPASPLISKRHCALILREDKIFVRDFDSTNGTFVNEQPVKGEVELKNKDNLKVGPIAFVVVLEADAPLDRRTPPPPTKSVGPKKAMPAVNDETKIPAKKEAGAAKKEPAKPTVKAPVADAGSDDDDVAAMLMSLQDEDGATSGFIPDGSTVFDLPAPGQPGSPGEEKKLTDADKEKEKSKLHQGNTSNAAKSILEKMMKRPRS